MIPGGLNRIKRTRDGLASARKCTSGHTSRVRRLDEDDELREAARLYVESLAERSGGPVHFRDLQRFEFRGRSVPLIHQPKGIKVVRGFDVALTILTTYRARPQDRPYEDAEGLDGYLRYKWRGTDPRNHDNVALRRALETQKQLIWFFGIASGVYTPLTRAWIVGEEPELHQFVVAADAEMRDQWIRSGIIHPVDLVLRRQYAQATVQRRLHQRIFRERVLRAYVSQCALCRLRHPELLDAAHIKEDSEGGEPVIPNGVAMCAIHHRAFDAQVLGVRPDYVIEIRSDVRDEHNGPTLRFALQGLHGESLSVPRQKDARPDTVLLEERYERFRAAV